MQPYYISYLIVISLFALACRNNNAPGPADHIHKNEEVYTCPMHPEIVRNKPGACPICGMDLVKKHEKANATGSLELGTLLKPANEFIISNVPVTVMEEREEDIELRVVGRVAYDTRQAASISSRVNGRIERLYIHYKYQQVEKGQRIMDIYSQDLVTAQQNLLFVLKNDSENSSLIEAAKNRLLVLGLTVNQIDDIIKNGKLQYTIPVFSKYSGFITDLPGITKMPPTDEMENLQPGKQVLSIREGMYVKSGQSIFSVYNADKAWILLNIYPGQETLLQVGDAVRVVPETAPDKNFRTKVSYIEPVFREGNKTLNARIYYNNSLKLPIGTRVTATVFSNAAKAWWLPQEAVVSLGRDKIVFKKERGGFMPHKIITGLEVNRSLQVIDGLKSTDSVAVNAHYLVDNETFIKVNH